MGKWIMDILETLFILVASSFCASFFGVPFGEVLLIILIGEMVRARNT